MPRTPAHADTCAACACSRCGQPARCQEAQDTRTDERPAPDPARTEAAVDVLLVAAAVSGGRASSRFDHDDARALLRALGAAGFLGWGVT